MPRHLHESESGFDLESQEYLYNDELNEKPVLYEQVFDASCDDESDGFRGGRALSYSVTSADSVHGSAIRRRASSSQDSWELEPLTSKSPGDASDSRWSIRGAGVPTRGSLRASASRSKPPPPPAMPRPRVSSAFRKSLNRRSAAELLVRGPRSSKVPEKRPGAPISAENGPGGKNSRRSR